MAGWLMRGFQMACPTAPPLHGDDEPVADSVKNAREENTCSSARGSADVLSASIRRRRHLFERCADHVFTSAPRKRGEVSSFARPRLFGSWRHFA